jgi:Ni,Fe-hydrogenase III small subunit/formate hydrogenlyase subunit 6/NADH:ubiquinone oxidoreductase subunit I
MFHIFQKSVQTGLVTIGYPQKPAQISAQFRGAPAFDFSAWRDARPAAEACPTGAIQIHDFDARRSVTVDYGLCNYCGECAEADGTGAVKITQEFELAVRQRNDLIVTAEYALRPDGSQGELVEMGRNERGPGGRRYRSESAGGPGLGIKTEETTTPSVSELESLERNVQQKIHRLLGRSLSIREVDAGSCNGCEMEIGALNNPIYDLERLGIHFVASPRHADMLLVTGPVTRNMELALVKTWRATPEPKIVIASGSCAISGGIFGVNYATRGAVDAVIPVDVFIPGCPPRPHALLHGILLALGRMEQRALPQGATVVNPQSC